MKHFSFVWKYFRVFPRNLHPKSSKNSSRTFKSSKIILNVHNLEYFKFVMKTFSKICSGTLRHFSKMFRNILTFLIDCPIFIMFRNYQFIPKHSDLFWEHFKNALENFHDCSEIFRFVFGTFHKCFGTLRRLQKCSEIFWLVQ